MSSSPEDFETLRRLLACKRHEVPPPGYFNRLSDQVLTRLEEEDAIPESSWWDYFLSRFDARPFWACAYGFAVSSLLLMGFRLSQIFENEAMAAGGPPGPWLATTPDPSNVVPGQFMQAHLGTSSGLASFSSVSPDVEVESHAARLSSAGLRVQPAAFTFSPR